MGPMIHRHRGSLVATTAFVIVVLFLASLVAAFTIDDKSVTPDRALPAEVATPADTSPIQPAIDLAPLVTPAPAGFDRTITVVDGAVTADQMAQGRPPAALALFNDLGLQGGYVRTWQRTGSDERVAVRLYQFGRPSAAARYVAAAVGATNTPDRKRFDVPGVDGGIGLGGGIPTDGLHQAFVWVPKGRLVMVVAALGQNPPDLNMVTALARAQVALLP